ncbi:hypothetical protein [Enterobacter sp. A103]|uniref:hypothetical protein n=1 Tax=Enterobacter sp. A103 TaxID=3102785 RepID=UPI002ACAC930|nr:hypothetical protein [Enterobacter sp. A103]MDZ5639026.1 hypothetical protein [Enterobacter sp. A103]
MKLIEFLVLKGREGWCWPNGITKAAVILGGGAVSFFYNDNLPPALSETLISPRYFRDHECVTREQYEAALAASKTEWDGNGLPLVGCEFEFRANVNSSWNRGVMCVVDYTNPFNVVVDDQCGIYRVHELEFRPIRSEADKRRDEAIDAMDATFREAAANGANGQRAVFTAIYDAIKSGKNVID